MPAARIQESDAERRARLGRETRLRNRDAMLDAILSLIRERGAADPTFDECIKACGMARGTFYNHFKSKEQMMLAAAERVADDIDARILPLVAGIDDPAQRVAISIRAFIGAARERPEWGWVLVRTPPASNAGWSREMQLGVRADIRRGRQSGRFAGITDEAAITLGIGALANALHTTLTKRTPRDFGETMAALTLRAFGVPMDEADRLARLPLPRP